MTLDTYADLFDADLDDLSARMGELLFAGGVGKMWHGRWNLLNLRYGCRGFSLTYKWVRVPLEARKSRWRWRQAKQGNVV